MQYRVLGFIVWKGATWYIRRKYGGAPKKVAAGGLVAAGLATALLVLQRRSASSD
ncbi:MAG: hypothetical protein M3Z33_08290 [Actinomycetota bacterium]|nr:hypothetical protein [Actinomycetota bacterium]